MGLRLLSLVPLLFFISQVNCSRSSLSQSIAVSLHNYRHGLALTALVTTILMPIITTIGNDVGDTIFQQGKRLYNAIRARFTKEPDNKADRVLENFAADPEEYHENFQNKLFLLLETDSTFAEELRRIIQAGPRQSLTIEEEAIARHIRMVNKAGIGEQTVKGGKRSTMEDIKMQIE